jgi:hypothetical protein
MRRKATRESLKTEANRKDSHKMEGSGIATAIPWERQEGRMASDFFA